ncbi:MAG: helix-turn-helix domain-containing protein [Saprospiraceae bacterium]
MTDKDLIGDFFKQPIALEDDRRSELSYLFMQHVVHLCEERGWSISRLADEVGVHRSQMSRALSGMANLRLDTIAKIETALQTPILEVNREPSLTFEKRGFPSRPPAGRLQVTFSIDNIMSDVEKMNASWSLKPGIKNPGNTSYAIAA